MITAVGLTISKKKTEVKDERGQVTLKDKNSLKYNLRPHMLLSLVT